MKERNRVFAILLAIMMVFTYMPGLAYAAAGDEPDPDVTVESQEEATVEEPVQEEPAEASEPAEAEAPAEAAEPAETKAPAEAAEPEAKNEEPAKAEAAQGKLSAAGSAKMVPGAKIADNNELFEQYFSAEVDKALGKSVQKRGAKSPRAYNLNEIEQYIYSQILMMMQDIAYAKVSRAVVSIDLKDQLGDYLVDTGDAKYPWAITSESLGLEDGEAVFVPYEDEEGTVWDLSEEAKANLFDIGKVVDAILLDQPYYAFWFDKIEGYLPEFNALLDTSGTGSDAHFAEEPNLTLSFTVAEAYRAADGADEFDVDSQKAESTLAAVASVEQIVAENGGNSDLEKLYAYKNKICDLTSYNYDAAQDPDMPYGDPWQLIYVFDGNEDTKVVCEGYAKAFQFLCDKSGFASPQIDCNTVTGEMMSDGGETEGHMWNILHMDDGRNYIADITNCDNDNPEEGYPDYLFLKGYTDGSVEDGYVYNEELRYTYDSEALSQYEYEDLEMSAYDYGEAGDDDDDEDAEYEWSGPDYIFSNGDAVFTLPEEAVVPEGCELDLRVGINTYEPDEGDHGWVLDFTEGKEYDFDRDTMTLTLHGPAVGEAINTEDSDYGRRISFFAGVIVDGGSGWLASGYSEFVYIDESISKVEFYGTNGRGTKENPIQLIENNGGYWDDHEGIEYYYYELDSFKAGDAVVVHYTDGTEKTFTFDDYYCEFCDSDSNFLEYWPQVIDDQTECENGWTINDAEPHKATVMIGGHETTVYFKVVANPVKAVSFQREGGVVLTEGADGANSDGADSRFMEYWLEFRKGDTLTITVQEDENEDPVEKVYVGEEEEEEGSGDSTFKFVNTADKNDCLYYRDVYTDSDPQSAATEWKYNDGKEHWFTVEYMGVVSDHIPVTMLQNPVSSFVFERSGGVVLTEGVDGDYDTDNDGEEFFWYDFYFKPGDQLVVTGPDGKVKWYEAVAEDDEGDWVYRFVRRDAAGTGEFIEDDYIEANRIDATAQPRQWDTHWTTDGEGYSFELFFSGHAYTVPVTLAENQIKGISFSRPGYDDEHPVELMDRIDGWYDEEYEQFRYNLIFKEGDVLTVNYGDAEYDYIYTYSDDGMPDAFVLSEEYSDVPEDVPQAIRDDNIGTWGEDPEDEDEPWGIGEEHVCTIYYNGRTCEVSVVTVANPVENISFERDGYSEDDPIELKEGGDYSYEEDGVTKYVCPLEDGDRLVVNKDGSDIVYDFVRIQTDEGAEERFVNTEDPDDVLVIPWDVWWDSEQSEGEEWHIGDIGTFTLCYMGTTCSIYVKIVEGSDGPDIPDDQIVTTLHPEADGSVRTIVSDEMSNEMNFPENGDSIEVEGVTYTYDSASDSFKNGSDEIGWYFWGTDSDYDEDTDEYTFYFIVQYEKNGVELGKSWIETVYGNEILGIEFTPNGRTELNASDIQDGEGGYDVGMRGDGSFFIEGDTIKLTNEFNGKTTVYEFTYDTESDDHDFHCDDYGDAPTYAICNNPVIGNNTVRILMLGAETTTTIRIVDGGTHTHTPVKIDAKDATCTEPGNSAYWTCSGCGKYFSDEACTKEIAKDSWVIPAKGHDFGRWEHHNADQHKRVCTREGCGAVEYENHTWNDGEITTEPTETTAGVKTFTCTVCGETKTEAVPPLQHVHTVVVIPAVEATCTAKGSTEGKKCSVCGEILVAPQEIPAKGHSWGKATYAWDSDYTQVTGTRNCTVCHESEQAIAKTASSEVTKAPTTKEKGEIIYTSEAFKVDGFEVQTVKVEIPTLTPAQAIDQAQDQTNEADGKATAVENSTDEGAISDAEDAAAKAAAYAAMAEEAASDALEQASVDYARISKDPSATPEQIETATTNLKNAATNLAVAKQLTAAANSAVARTKKTAAKVAANKAAAAYNAAQSAANSTAAEQFRKEAEAYATTAAEKAGAADTASANAAKAVSDLEDLAKEMADSPVAEAVSGAIADAQNQANTSAGAASNAATDADKSKDNANESAGNAKTAVDNKKKAEAEAALDQAFNGIPDKKIKKVKGLKKSKMTKSAITVKWTKLSKKNLGGATKYEVWACPNKGFKRADTKFKTFSKGKSSGKISGLKKNTKYFVKVRAIRIVGGVKYVGPWSSAKGIKTKK